MSALLFPLRQIERDDFASLAKKLTQPHVQLGGELRTHVAVSDVIARLPAHQNCAVVPSKLNQLCKKRSASWSLTGVVNDASVGHRPPHNSVRYLTDGTIKVPARQVRSQEKFARVVA